MSAFNPISLSALAPDLCSALYRVPLTIGEYEELKARNVKLEEWVRNAEEQVREATAGDAKASTIPGTKPLPLVLLEGWYEVVWLLSLAAACRPLQIVHRLEYRVMYAIMSMRHLTFSKASSFHV